MHSAASVTPPPQSLWRDTICPKEHGSWSLALEPLALALLVAPSLPGACLGASLVAAFFCRRPLRLWILEKRPARRAAARRALLLCGAIAGISFALAVVLAGTAWLLTLLPAAIAGAAFAFFDARGNGREEIAELCGATAFALTPVALAALAGLPLAGATALGALMVARSAPSVATVRAFLRAAKTGVRRDAFAVLSSAGALATAVALAWRGLAPWSAAVVMLVFATRTVALLLTFRPSLRARTLGMIETGLGLAFVATLAVTWPR